MQPPRNLEATPHGESYSIPHRAYRTYIWFDKYILTVAVSITIFITILLGKKKIRIRRFRRKGIRRIRRIRKRIRNGKRHIFGSWALLIIIDRTTDRSSITVVMSLGNKICAGISRNSLSHPVLAPILGRKYNRSEQCA